jgi:hypothetical protein
VLNHHARPVPHLEAFVSSFAFSGLEHLTGFFDGLRIVQSRQDLDCCNVSASLEDTAHGLPPMLVGVVL